VHVDPVIVHEPRQFIDLFDGRELGLVNDEDLHTAIDELLEFIVNVASWRNGLGGGLNANATRHHAVGTSITECPQRHVTATLSQLPTEL
jgi:hypothetical protein